MRLRTLGAVAVAVLALVGLTGCRTNVGTAATVDGHRITDSDVSKYVLPAGPDKQFVAQVQQNGQTLPSARTFVLHYLVQGQVFERTLDWLGDVPSDGQLASYHDAAASVLLNTQLAGPALDKALRDGLPKSGVDADFAQVYLRTTELEYAVIKAKQLTRQSELVSLVKKAGVDVSVSSRYGTWNAGQLTVQGGIQPPPYLTVQSGGAAPAGAGAAPHG